MPRFRLPILIALLLGFAVLAVGCDNTLEPFDEETGLYSIYGYLTFEEGPHYIRVKDLNDPLIEDSTRTLDATVMFENQSTGTSIQLRDTMLVFDGVYTHNYLVETPVQPNTRYRVVVERSDGATSSATATTPRLVDVERVWDTPQDCRTNTGLDLHDLENTRLVRAWVGFQYRGDMYWMYWNVSQGHDNTLQVRFNPEGTLGELIDSQDNPDTDLWYEPRCAALDEDQFYVAYTHFGPEWLEVNLPLQPLESWGVDDGLGFFGALHRDTIAVPVDTSRIQVLP